MQIHTRLPARISDAGRVRRHGHQVVVGVKQQGALAVEVFDGAQLEIVDEIRRTVGVVAETWRQVQNNHANYPNQPHQRRCYKVYRLY